MNKKSALIALILGLALLVSACSEKPASSPETPTPPVNTDEEPAPPAPADTEPTPVVTEEPKTPTPPSTPTASSITLAELSTHNTRDDCWVAYKGKVYDVTAWLPRHPGGVSAIESRCGTASEFEAAFNRKHGTKQEARLEKESTFKGALA